MNGDTYLAPEAKEQYGRAIVTYLHHMKTRHARASVASAKNYVEASSTRRMPETIDREALRWFFRAAGQRGCR